VRVNEGVRVFTGVREMVALGVVEGVSVIVGVTVSDGVNVIVGVRDMVRVGDIVGVRVLVRVNVCDGVNVCVAVESFLRTASTPCWYGVNVCDRRQTSVLSPAAYTSLRQTTHTHDIGIDARDSMPRRHSLRPNSRYRVT
jgi:hypothetical protein